MGFRNRPGSTGANYLAKGCMFVICVPIGFIVVMAVVGVAIETFGQNREEHDRCLKNATNGYEIKQCR